MTSTDGAGYSGWRNRALVTLFIAAMFGLPGCSAAVDSDPDGLTAGSTTAVTGSTARLTTGDTPATAPRQPSADPRPVLIVSQEGGGAFCSTYDPLQISTVAYDDGSVIDLDPCAVFTESTSGSIDVDQLRAEASAFFASADAAVVMDDFEDVGVGISDVGTTVVTYIDADGARHVVRAFALGFGPRELLSSNELAAREALQRFLDAAATATGSKVPWTPGGLTITPISMTQTVPQDAETWPLGLGAIRDMTSGSGAECESVQGAQAKLLISRQVGRPASSPWQANGKTFAVTISPELAGVNEC